MSKLRLLIGKGCRSDAPLSDPIIKALREETDWCHLQTIQLEPADFSRSYRKCQTLFDTFQYDLVLVIGDRIEAMSLSLSAFLNNQATIHLGSGITNEPISTYDDILRHCICLLSNIQLVEDINSFKVTHDLLSVIKKANHNIHIIGNPYADGLNDLDFSLVPDEPYSLILINPETLQLDENLSVLNVLEHTEFDQLNIFIGPNPDPNILNHYKIKYTYDSLPRPQFLGLLSKCERFISNSSCVYYEAPYFLKPEQIIIIGSRNLKRSTPKTLEGGSTVKIVEILKKWWSDQNGMS